MDINTHCGDHYLILRDTSNTIFFEKAQYTVAHTQYTEIVFSLEEDIRPLVGAENWLYEVWTVLQE